MPEEPFAEDDREEIENFNTFISKVVNGLSDENLKEFGNCNPPCGFYVHIGSSNELNVETLTRKSPNAASGEPMLDIILENRLVKVVAELRGITKDHITVKAKAEELSINGSGEGSLYSRVVTLPRLIDPKTAKARYNNGILEITAMRIITDGTFSVPVE